MAKKSDPMSKLELPRIVQLRNNLSLACFHLMKLLPARFMLDRAEESGRLRQAGMICESTSGTFGLALAMLGAQRGYRVKLVSDPAADAHLIRQLEALGTQIEVVTTPTGTNYQEARLRRLHEIRETNEDSYWPAQYNNPDNPNAYGRFAEQLVEEVGKIDCLVGAVGSGGSMSGTASLLRNAFPELYVIGVDTPCSVLFGQPDGKRLLRGLGNSLIPGNLNHRLFDEVHWVTAAEAFLSTRRLCRQHGLFMGGTSGAAFLVADWYARNHPDKRVVAILPDSGNRYTETIYSDNWLSSIPGFEAGVPDGPSQVHSVTDPVPVWSHYIWARQSLAQATGNVPLERVA